MLKKHGWRRLMTTKNCWDARRKKAANSQVWHTLAEGIRIGCIFRLAYIAPLVSAEKSNPINNKMTTKIYATHCSHNIDFIHF
jgi:hypothetical protein